MGYLDEWDLKGFLDGDVKLDAKEYEKLPLPLLGDIQNYEVQHDDVFVCAIADCAARERLTGIMEQKSAEFINLIHRTALISPIGVIGIGAIVTAYCVIPPNYRIGNYIIMNTSAGLAHDVQVGDCCSFMAYSGIMGYGTAGNRVYMASGAKALPHAILEDDAYIGVNSVVFKRAKRGQKLFGNPASPIGW